MLVPHELRHPLIGTLWGALTVLVVLILQPVLGAHRNPCLHLVSGCVPNFGVLREGRDQLHVLRNESVRLGKATSAEYSAERFPTKLGPKTTPDGPSSKNDTKRTKYELRKQIIVTFRDLFLFDPKN